MLCVHMSIESVRDETVCVWVWRTMLCLIVWRVSMGLSDQDRDRASPSEVSQVR